MTNIYRCTPRQIRSYIIDIIGAGLVPFVTSSPGMGKSEIHHSVAKDFKLKMIDHRLSTSQPEDLSGYPDLKSGRAKFVPFDLFPTEDQEVPTGYEGWLLFLDEFNSASKGVQAASYKLILDRMVGQSKLHPNVAIAAAGNLATDRAIVNPLSTAMQSRVINLEMEINFKEWQEDVAIPRNYDPRIMAYLNQYPSKLMDFKPEHEDKSFCCPRTWSFVNDLIKGKDITSYHTPMLAGTLTSGIAVEFVQFTQIFKEIVSIHEIVKDPENCRLPFDLGAKWAVICHLMEVVDAKNLKQVAKYTERFDFPFRVLFMRSLLIRHPEMKQHPDFISQMSVMAKYLAE